MRSGQLVLWGALALGCLPGPASADPPGSNSGPSNGAVLLPPQISDDSAKAPNTTRERHGEWSISGGVLFLQPVFETNPAFTVAGAGGNISRQVDFSHHLDASPNIWLAYADERGWGLRGRWFQFDNDTSESVAAGPGETIRGVSLLPLGQTPIAGIGTASSHLHVNVFDLQGTCQWDSAFWSHLAGFGVRYTHMSQDYRAALANLAARIDLSSDHNFNGAGPCASFETHRRLGESGFAIYGQAYGAILFGNASEGYVAVNNGIPQYFAHTRTEVLPVGEMELGAEYCRTLGRARAFVQAGFAGQIWWNGGNASNLDALGGQSGSHSNFGFLGVALRAGVRY